MHPAEWVIAAHYHDMRDYGIRRVYDTVDGEVWITCENPWKNRR